MFCTWEWRQKAQHACGGRGELHLCPHPGLVTLTGEFVKRAYGFLYVFPPKICLGIHLTTYGCLQVWGTRKICLCIWLHEVQNVKIIYYDVSNSCSSMECFLWFSFQSVLPWTCLAWIPSLAYPLPQSYYSAITPLIASEVCSHKMAFELASLSKRCLKSFMTTKEDVGLVPIPDLTFQIKPVPPICPMMPFEGSKQCCQNSWRSLEVSVDISLGIPFQFGGGVGWYLHTFFHVQVSAPLASTCPCLGFLRRLAQLHLPSVHVIKY